MSKLTWHGTGEKKFETGVDQGVLYRFNETANKWLGKAWNGLTGVTESPEGAEVTDLWADNEKYASMRSAENYKGNIEAYTYPDDFMNCDGSAELAGGIVIGQQSREAFGFCYRTRIGSDLGSEIGHKLHLVYNCTCSPSEKSYTTVNDSPDAITFSWDFESTPVAVTGHKSTSTLTIDTTKLTTAQLTALEDALYGTESADAYLPYPDDVMTILAGAAGGDEEEDPEDPEGDPEET